MAASDLWMKSQRKPWGPVGRCEHPRALGPLPPIGVEVEDRGSQAATQTCWRPRGGSSGQWRGVWLGQEMILRRKKKTGGC